MKVPRPVPRAPRAPRGYRISARFEFRATARRSAYANAYKMASGYARMGLPTYLYPLTGKGDYTVGVVAFEYAENFE